MIEKNFEIPIGIYRSMAIDPTSARSETDVLRQDQKLDCLQEHLKCDHQIRQILRDRLLRLESEQPTVSTAQMPTNANKYATAKGSTESNSSIQKFVIVNPEPNTKLLKDDIVYLIRPELLTTDPDSAFLPNDQEQQLSQQNPLPLAATQPSGGSNGAATQAFQQSGLRKESRAMSNSNPGLTPISEDNNATGTDSSLSGLSDTKTITTTVMDSL